MRSLEIRARTSFAVQSLPKQDLHTLRYTMNDDQPGNAASQQKRGRHECSTQRAPGIEPAMPAKDDRDVSLQLCRLPTAQAAPDLQDHRQFKQAAAPRGGYTARGKDLCQQQ
jgi:hypothetical protein